MSKPPYKSGGPGRGRSTGGSRPGDFKSGGSKSGNSRPGSFKAGKRDNASGEDRRDASSRGANDRESGREFGRGGTRGASRDTSRGTGPSRQGAKQEKKSSFGDRRRERAANDRARRDRGSDPRNERPRTERDRTERDRSDLDRSARARDERAFSAERGHGRPERRDDRRDERRPERRDERRPTRRDERAFGERPVRESSPTERGRPASQGETRSFGERRSIDRGPRAGGASYAGERSGGARYNGERAGAGRSAPSRDHGERGQFDRSRLDRANRPAQNARKAAHPAPRAAAPTPKDPTLPEREGERIAKLLARAGIASRREAERLVEAGRVKLGDEVIETPSTVLTSLQGVTVDGVPVREAEETRLFVFHKPAGLLTAERDPAGRPTIYTALRNALPEGAGRVMPVGRLDLNTEGLLLLTNDGEFKRQLELPSTGVPRTYRARTFGDITQAQLEELMHGIEIEGVIYGSINANMERRTGRNQWIELTLTEGKNREVRRVLEALGLQVSRLLRTAYGPFVLGDMPKGAAGEISPKDLDTFRRSLVKGGNTGKPQA